MFTLLLHEIGHSATYFLLAIALTKVLKYEKYPWKLILLGYIVTIGLDADHLLDYMLATGWNGFSFKNFIYSDYMLMTGKVYLIFHAWEWVLLSVLFYLLFHEKYNFFLFIAIGIAAQLLFDTVSYGFNWDAYFIFHRAFVNFNNHIFLSKYN